MRSYSVEVKRNERGAWCVWLDGQWVSDHRSAEAARIAAQRHIVASVDTQP